jgi:hypothetical protein
VWSRVRTLVLVLTIILLPSSARWILIPDPEIYYAVGIGLADIAMAALIVLTAPLAISRFRRARPQPVLWIALALAVVIVAAFALHPSAQGVQTLFHLVGAFAILCALTEVRDERGTRLLLFGLIVMTIAQTALSTAQLVRGDLLLPFEHPPIRRYGPFIRVNGTFPDSFMLAGYGLVVATLLAREAMRRAHAFPLAALIPLAIAPVGYTFSRAALVAVGLVAVTLVPGALRGLPARRVVLAALLLGFGVPALVTSAGWLAREDDSDLSNSAGQRVLLIRESLPIVLANFVTGVGPGNTMAALREREAREPGSVPLMQPPHDVPYLIALEAGVPAGALATVLLGGLGLLALLGRDRSLVVYVALGPYLVLDNFPFTAAAGLPLVALWSWGSLPGGAPHEMNA